MAVVIETTLGDITVDLFVEQRPQACLNFIKLCKLKYYNLNLFHTIRSGFIAQTGDPTGEGSGGESIWGVLNGSDKKYFSAETRPKIKHSDIGTVSMVGVADGMIGSQFFFTLSPDLDSLDAQHCVIGEVAEGHDVLRKLNEVICDTDFRPYQDVRITHTVVLEDPFGDPRGFREASGSPPPTAERLAGGRIAPDEELDETKGKTDEEVAEMMQEKEAKARATILEIVGDLPDADIAPPENVLFVCKLNPVTTDEDLEIIFSRFGAIKTCEVIRDKKSGDSLQYAFIEFEARKSCEDAYFKMDNVLIDDRRIHVDFSQSVSKLKWRGKGRGVIRLDNSDVNSVYDHEEDKRRNKKGGKITRKCSDENSPIERRDDRKRTDRNLSSGHKDREGSRKYNDNHRRSDRDAYSSKERGSAKDIDSGYCKDRMHSDYNYKDNRKRHYESNYKEDRKQKEKEKHDHREDRKRREDANSKHHSKDSHHYDKHRSGESNSKKRR